MAITVDPAFTPPAPAQQVTSPDGLLTAQVDATNAGVLLWADFSAVTPLPDLVEFHRGDGTLVRSGDPSSAPGGVAWAYDHEAPVGSAASYYAVPLSFAGVAGVQTDTVTVATPWSWDPSDVWIKSPIRPDLSLLAHAATFEETARPLRTSFTALRSQRLGAGAWDVSGGLSGTLTVYTDGRTEYDAMLALIDGSPLLIQAHPDLAGIPVFYAMPTGDLLSQRRVDTGTGWDMRAWPLQLTECRRPATLDAPLRIPGNTAATLPDRYPTCADLLARVGTCAELVGVSL